MDLSWEIWDESIAADRFIIPTLEKHSIPPIQWLEDLIGQDEKAYRFPDSAYQ